MLFYIYYIIYFHNFHSIQSADLILIKSITYKKYVKSKVFLKLFVTKPDCVIKHEFRKEVENRNLVKKTHTRGHGLQATKES